MNDDLQLGKLKETVCYSSFIANSVKCFCFCHQNPGSSMVRASHRRSEGCGFDPRLGFRDIFLSLR